MVQIKNLVQHLDLDYQMVEDWLLWHQNGIQFQSNMFAKPQFQENHSRSLFFMDTFLIDLRFEKIKNERMKETWERKKVILTSIIPDFLKGRLIHKIVKFAVKLPQKSSYKTHSFVLSFVHSFIHFLKTISRTHKKKIDSNLQNLTRKRLYCCIVLQKQNSRRISKK